MDIYIFVWIFYGALLVVGLTILAWELGREVWHQLVPLFIRVEKFQFEAPPAPENESSAPKAPAAKE